METENRDISEVGRKASNLNIFPIDFSRLLVTYAKDDGRISTVQRRRSSISVVSERLVIDDTL